jgi:uncharacterized protein DUF4382
MRPLLSRSVGALLFTLIGVLGCNDSSAPSGMTGTNGKLTLLLKDAPGDIQAAVVTIDKVYLQGEGGSTVLRDTPVTTNLLTLADTSATLAQDVIVPAGTYSQLRFVISGAYIAVDNGDGTSRIYASSPDYAGLPPGSTVAGQLQMPSFAQSGLKVNLPGGAFTVVGDDQRVLVVDFDVSQSFGHQAGNSGRWVMHPVLTATEFTTGAFGDARIDLTRGAGVTLPAGVALTNFTATITGPDNIPHTAAFVAGASPDTASASFGPLPPGTYAVTMTAPAGVSSFTTVPALPGSVDIVSSQVAVASFELSAVTAAPGSARVDISLGAGVTLPAGVDLTGFTVTLTGSDAVPHTTAFVAGATPGTFSASIGSLAPGTYAITMTAPAGVTTFTTTPALPGSVNVLGGQEAVATFVLSAVT